MTDAPPALRSYRTGEWYAVLGEQVAVLVPPSERSRVAALWELVDRGADADEVLDALIAGGLRALPAFVLVDDTGDRVRVLLRGPARAGIDTHDGPVALDGADATTWVERVLSGVTAVRIDVDGHAPGAEDRRVDTGLLRVGRVDRPPYAEPVVAGEEVVEDVVPVAVDTPARDPEPVVEPDVEPDPEPAPAPRAENLGLSLLDDPEPDDSELTEAIALPADVGSWGAPTVPPPPVPPAGWSGGDHDGATRHGGPGEDQLVRDQPGIPGQPPAPSVTRPVAHLDFSHGESVEVDRVVLVGRAPEARRFTVTEQPRLVTVPSPHQEISSTHLEIRPGSGADHGSAVVTDLGSTNGTVLVQPGLPPEALQPGIAVQLLPGAVVDLGDGVTIRVSHPRP